MNDFLKYLEFQKLFSDKLIFTQDLGRRQVKVKKKSKCRSGVIGNHGRFMILC